MLDFKIILWETLKIEDLDEITKKNIYYFDTLFVGKTFVLIDENNLDFKSCQFFMPLKAKLLLDFDSILWESFGSDAGDNVGLKRFLLK